MISLTPPVSCRYGGPMGRASDVLDPCMPVKARRVALDQGYDRGGVYWGLRPLGYSLYAVWQDGGRTVAFVDARSKALAIWQALGEHGPEPLSKSELLNRLARAAHFEVLDMTLKPDLSNAGFISPRNK